MFAGPPRAPFWPRIVGDSVVNEYYSTLLLLLNNYDLRLVKQMKEKIFAAGRIRTYILIRHHGTVALVKEKFFWDEYPKDHKNYVGIENT